MLNWNAPSPEDQVAYDPAEIFAAGLVMHQIANTAYPIAHVSTMRPYKVPRSEVQSVAPQAWQGLDRLGLYVHIPFCEVRCGFCEYTVVDPAGNADSEDLYFELLLREFELYEQALNTSARTLVGFDIGGGTPSIARTANIERLLESARRHFQFSPGAAISIETTPKIAAHDPDKLRAYYDLGIRRISMGVQTISPRLLEMVGRTVTSVAYNQAAAENVRRAGFQRFNVDVMYGFARQELPSVEATLRHVFSLEPDYITLYRTRYKGTRIAAQGDQVSLAEVNAQAALAKAMLSAAGYHATPGKNTFSRIPGDVGTSEYLTERVIYGTPYLGLGLGAQSLSHTSLAYNSGAADKRIQLYQRNLEQGQLPIQDLYHLSLPAAMAKMIAVSFYFGEVHLNGFARKFGLELAAAFPAETAFVLAHGLMAYHGDAEQQTLRLTAAGVENYNGVIALFYAGAVKQHLLDQAGPSLFAAAVPVGAHRLERTGWGARRAPQL